MLVASLVAILSNVWVAIRAFRASVGGRGGVVACVPSIYGYNLLSSSLSERLLERQLTNYYLLPEIDLTGV